MFYLSSLSKEICLYPKDLTNDLTSNLSREIEKLEGKIIGNVGIIVKTVEFNQISSGNIDNETGRILYKINYKAITFNLEKDEIIDAIPFFINEQGFFCKIAHCQIFVSQHLLEDWEYDVVKNIWKNSKKQSENTVKINELIKLKIIMVRINSDEITSMATIVN